MEEKLKEEGKSVNKRLYKILLLILKYTPFILAINETLFTILHYYEIDCIYLNISFGVSFIFLLQLYIISYVFKFCYLYRIPLYYVTVVNLIALYDGIIGIPISDLQMLRVYLSMAGISIISYIFLKVKRNAETHNKKSTSEVYR